MLLGLAAALGAAAAFGSAALLQALAARREESAAGLDPRLLLRLLRQPAYLGAVGLSLGGYAMHVVALRSAPLFLVQAVIASAVAVTAVLRAVVYRVRPRASDLLAVLAVCVGVALLAVSALTSGSQTTTRGQRALLLAAVAVLVVLAALAGGAQGPTGAALLGFLAGCGYAVVAIGTRLLPDLRVATLVSDPATYSVVVAGVLAFLLYSTALQRSGLLTSTTAMIVSQTAVPSVVGVSLLGDRIRPGWTPVAVAALVLALAGAIVLTRRDTLAEEIDPQDRGTGEQSPTGP